jgi:hypothetical protein
MAKITKEQEKIDRDKWEEAMRRTIEERYSYKLSAGDYIAAVILSFLAGAWALSMVGIIVDVFFNDYLGAIVFGLVFIGISIVLSKMMGVLEI